VALLAVEDAQGVVSTLGLEVSRAPTAKALAADRRPLSMARALLGLALRLRLALRSLRLGLAVAEARATATPWADAP
jgi:hypothetical protein